VPSTTKNTSCDRKACECSIYSVVLYIEHHLSHTTRRGIAVSDESNTHIHTTMTSPTNHTYHPQPTKMQNRPYADLWMRKNKTKKAVKMKLNEYYTSERRASPRKTRKGNNTHLCPEIVPVGVVRLSRPRIGRKNALNTPALRPSPFTPTRSVHLQYMPGSVLLCTLRHARRERVMRTRLLAFPSLSATRRFGLRDDRWRRWECGWCGLEQRSWYSRWVYPLSVVEVR
jgi:hypothetical protein